MSEAQPGPVIILIETTKRLGEYHNALDIVILKHDDASCIEVLAYDMSERVELSNRIYINALKLASTFELSEFTRRCKEEKFLDIQEHKPISSSDELAKRVTDKMIIDYIMSRLDVAAPSDSVTHSAVPTSAGHDSSVHQVSGAGEKCDSDQTEECPNTVHAKDLKLILKQPLLFEGDGTESTLMQQGESNIFADTDRLSVPSSLTPRREVAYSQHRPAGLRLHPLPHSVKQTTFFDQQESQQQAKSNHHDHRSVVAPPRTGRKTAGKSAGMSSIDDSHLLENTNVLERGVLDDSTVARRKLSDDTRPRQRRHTTTTKLPHLEHIDNVPAHDTSWDKYTKQRAKKEERKRSKQHSRRPQIISPISHPAPTIPTAPTAHLTAHPTAGEGTDAGSETQTEKALLDDSHVLRQQRRLEREKRRAERAHKQPSTVSTATAATSCNPVAPSTQALLPSQTKKQQLLSTAALVLPSTVSPTGQRRLKDAKSRRKDRRSSSVGDGSIGYSSDSSGDVSSDSSISSSFSGSSGSYSSSSSSRSSSGHLRRRSGGDSKKQGRHSNHLHGLKLVRKVGSFKYSDDSEYNYASALHVNVSRQSMGKLDPILRSHNFKEAAEAIFAIQEESSSIKDGPLKTLVQQQPQQPARLDSQYGTGSCGGRGGGCRDPNVSSDLTVHKHVYPELNEIAAGINAKTLKPVPGANLAMVPHVQHSPPSHHNNHHHNHPYSLSPGATTGVTAGVETEKDLFVQEVILARNFRPDDLEDPLRGHVGPGFTKHTVSHIIGNIGNKGEGKR